MGNREKAIASRLKKWESEFLAGKKDRFLMAMNLCLTFDLPIPDWAAWHFMQGAGRYESAAARTLDEAFEIGRPKSWRQSRARGRKGRGLIAHVKMRYLNQAGMPVQEAIAKVAQELHMSEATADSWYYDEELMSELGRRPQKSENSGDD